MGTKNIVERYFDSLKGNREWEMFLADEIQFTSFTNPIKRVAGKGAYLEATKRFYSMIKAVEVRGIIVDGANACALTRYDLQPPAGPAFECHVAEVFEVQGDRITSFSIYFDSAPFPK